MFAKRILRVSKTIAVIGLSRDPKKAAHSVPKYMQDQGFTILPVNPNVESETKLLGEKVYSSITDIQEPFDILNIFRPSKEIPNIVKDVVKLNNKPNMIWVQTGIINNEAKRIAEENNIGYIQNECIMVIHKNLN